MVEFWKKKIKKSIFNFYSDNMHHVSTMWAADGLVTSEGNFLLWMQ